jgi:hypothetical protein
VIAARTPFILLLLLGSGCTVSLDEEHLEDMSPPVADVHELCVQSPPAGVSQGAAFSLELPMGSTFIFGETAVEEGDTVLFLPNTEALATDPEDPCAFDYLRDSNGDLGVPIPLTEDELAFDESRTDGRRTALWPRGGFVAGDAGYVFYQKVALADYFDLAEVGTGVARIRPNEAAERLSVGRYAEEPLLTWVAPNSDWGTGALLGNDGMAYVYGCYQRASFDVGCRVARVDPEHVAEPDAYRYYDFDGNWSERVERASWILSGATNLSGFYSAALGRYVLLYSEFLGNRVYMVTAREPFGPFGEPVALATGLAPTQFWIGRVDVHPGLGSADGKRFVFGYHTDNPTAPGLHLVEAVLR